MSKERLYHIVAIDIKSDDKTYCTSYPMSYKECCTMLSKFSQHPSRTLVLEEVRNERHERSEQE